MRCAVLASDIDGRIVLLNELAGRILGLDPLPPKGTPVAEALAAHPGLVELLADAYRMSSLPSRAELDLGPGKRIGFTVSLIRGKSGGVFGAAVFFKDLTQIEHKEEQERTQGRLAALGEMAACLAHEIRNPLASIEVTCSLLKRRLDSDAAALELLQKVAREVRRLNSTVDSSLEFVRPVTVNLGASSIEPLLEEAINVAVSRRGRSGVIVRREFNEGTPPFLMDRSLLRQVFENLILNALEAVGSEGQVTISTGIVETPGEASVPYRPSKGVGDDPWQGAARCVVVRVSDTGPGIGSEDLDRIFYPLFTTKKQGSGIGLAVVRKIVNSHRGMIDVANLPGRGAEFSVRLPMALQTPEV